MRLNGSEKRKSSRQRRSGTISWRFVGARDTEPGWLLEESEDGMAFAWRGESPPEPGAIVELVEYSGDHTETSSTRAVIRRVLACHEDLSVIAIERVQYSPFPAVIGPELKPKGLVDRASPRPADVLSGYSAAA